MKKKFYRTSKQKYEILKTGFILTQNIDKKWKDNLPAVLPYELKEIAIGMILSDACMYKIHTHALIKFEQGYKQELFLMHLFSLFKAYSFMNEPGKRISLNLPRKGLIKSFWFKTFTHSSITEIWNLFYITVDNVNGKKYNKKYIQEGLIKNHLTSKGLAYWIMGDGSLQKDKKTMILHTQSYSKS